MPRSVSTTEYDAATSEHEPSWGECSDVIALGGGAASGGLAYDFPQAAEFKLYGLAFQLVTAAGGGNRQALVTVEDGTGVPVFRIAAPGVQAGGLTVVYSFANDSPTFGTAALGSIGGPLPRLWLPRSCSVAISVAGTAAGDALSDGRVLVRKRPVT